ncbi:glycosyltransferase [Escherichia coli]|uniref:glycosyltransferase n=1 Tax=Escherichia coli TaxID=562 RepID=UPI00388D644E
MGRRLDIFITNAGIQAPDNVTFESDIEPERLEQLYLESRLFLCPVRHGSGMKTKIAEALSYGLYVIANTRSTCGYETAARGFMLRVSCVNDATFIIDATSEIVGLL